MDFTKKSLLDYSMNDKGIYQTAADFNEYIEWLKANKYLYAHRISHSGSGPHILIKDLYTRKIKEMINFGGNEYLNLTKHPNTINEGVKALQKYGIGSGSAALLGGASDLHQLLEKKIAEFKGCEDAMIFSSGYGANVGTLLALMQKNDLAILDQFSHASMADGCLRATVRTFKHSDMNSLESILKVNAKGNYHNRMIIIDGVYSMDGDIAPLPEIMDIAKRYNAMVYMDEAHASGVLGNTGRGTAEHYNMKDEVDIVSGTFSKAFGSIGGFIAAKKMLINYLRYYSRSHMFATAMAPQIAASLIAGIDIMINEPERRQRLWDNINYLKPKLNQLGFNTMNSQTAIIPIIIGDFAKLSQFVSYLDDNNIFANPVAFPAVPVELSRIRISLMQGHTKEDLDALLYHLEKKGKELEVI